MAALRSGMAMLGRRTCGRSGSSSAAAMGGKGMEMHQVFRPAPPPLNTASIRNHESWRRFSTGAGESKDKAGSFRRLWQWAKYHVENVDPVTKTRAVGLYALVAIGTPTFYALNEIRTWRPSP